MKQWWYVRNREGYVVLESANSSGEAKQKASVRPGFDGDTEAWPKAVVPTTAADMRK